MPTEKQPLEWSEMMLASPIEVPDRRISPIHVHHKSMEQRQRLMQDLAVHCLVLHCLKYNIKPPSLRELRELTGIPIGRAKRIREEALSFHAARKAHTDTP